jgi:hypothetical protein
MKPKTRMPIRVVFYRDESDSSLWVAHCLEFDLMGHGTTRKKALRMLKDAIGIQVRNTVASGNYRNLFTPAPTEYQLMFARGHDLLEEAFSLGLKVGGFSISEFEFREFEEVDRELQLA